MVRDIMLLSHGMSQHLLFQEEGGFQWNILLRFVLLPRWELAAVTQPPPGFIGSLTCWESGGKRQCTSLWKTI